MKIQYVLITVSVMIFLYCTKDSYNKLFSGTWKIDKIEVFNKEKLRKCIDTGYQYWQFCKNDSILIFEHKRLQNCLQIKIDKHSIKSIDNNNRQDEFAINLLDKERLELSSCQKLNEQEYTIVYHLEKVNEKDIPELDSKRN